MHEELMNRTDRAELKTALALIKSGLVSVSEGRRMRRMVERRVGMRAKRAKDKA